MMLTWSKEIRYVSGGTHTYPKSDGVYVISKKIGKKSYPKYVGQGNLRERMDMHESKNEPNSCLKKVMDDRDYVRVHYAKVSGQTNLDNAEYTLWYYYGGTLGKLCNEIVPSGETVYDLNFPFAKLEV